MKTPTRLLQYKKCTYSQPFVTPPHPTITALHEHA